MEDPKTHNTFTLEELIDPETGDKSIVARSHNFPGMRGEGRTVEEALDMMNRAIAYFADNSPAEFASKIKKRVEAGLKCLCGVPLDGEPLIVWNSNRNINKQDKEGN